MVPKAPANDYLTPDDVRIFGNISGQKFLSLPWKGTVIGVATGNFPAVTKGGTLSVGSEITAYDFINAGCAAKTKIAEEYGVGYVYMPAFDCPGYEPVDRSSEGFVLYKVLKN